MTRLPDVEQAAFLCALGLDGWKYLSTSNRADRLVLTHLAERVAEIRETQERNLAVTFMNVYAEALKKS